MSERNRPDEDDMNPRLNKWTPRIVWSDWRAWWIIGREWLRRVVT